MPTLAPSPWKIPLVRELTVILLIKLTLLLTIKVIWFDQPTVPDDGTRLTSLHLLSEPQTTPTAKESTR